MEYLKLLLHEYLHFLLSCLAALLVLIYLYLTKKKHKKLQLKNIIPFIILGAFVGEFFLDVDHLFDYFIAFGFLFRPDYFFSGKMFSVNQKTYVFFHSWELVVVLGICARFLKNQKMKYFLLAVTVGLFLHLFYDTFYSHFSFLGYSFIFRLIHNFNPHYFSYDQ